MSNIIKETEFLIFRKEQTFGKKTSTIYVINKRSQIKIATIEWYGPWRQYCFMPERFDFETVWNITCLKAIEEMITMLMAERNQFKQGELPQMLEKIAEQKEAEDEAVKYKRKYEKCIKVIKRFDPGIIGMYDL